MPKSSPNLEERLAKIDIGLGNNLQLRKPTPFLTPIARRSPKKKLPPYTQPHVTPARQLTPSKEPFLSTAKRAEARSTSGRSKNASLAPLTPSKPGSANTPSRPTMKVSETGHTPGEKTKQNEDFHLFSFMKETSSSAMKRNVLSTSNAFKASQTFKSASPTPSMETKPQLQVQHKKRIPFGARRSQDSRLRKRVVSGKLMPPADITNYHIPVPTSKFSINLPMETTKVSFTRDSTQQHKLPRTLPRSRSSSTPLKLYIPRSSSRHSSIPDQTSLPKPKLKDLTELYHNIYHKNPQLFAASDEPEYTEQAPLQVQTIAAELGIYEKGEILRQSSVYYIAPTSKEKQFNIRNGKENFGFDDKQGNYNLHEGDHINYRYEVGKVLGTGSFGNVVLCKDHKYAGKAPKQVAIKVIKNSLEWTLQAVCEIKILKNLNKNKPSDNILQYFDHFHFRGHMCIVSEILSLNLFSLLEMINFAGMSLDLVSMISLKIASGLAFIHLQKIIHCDIKPENIMMKLPFDFDPDRPVTKDDLCVKIIDFGSSCYHNEVSHTYIQSRYYRAPEVIMGAEYSTLIDLWSFGCVAVELYTGAPLFLGKNELEQFALIVETLGTPGRKYIQQLQVVAKKKHSNRRPTSTLASDSTISKSLLFTLFDTDGRLNLQFLNMRLQVAANNHGVKKNVRPSSKNLDVQLKLNSTTERRQAHHFIKFLKRIFNWDPKERADANQLVEDDFLQLHQRI